ncbi:MAG: cyclodeaminase/cyclohydrolase family protein [Peptococcaceae bacterium]|nr:cyclodeaminase/cyclohydrolase family protein [Candidatus Syntrophopropionicum ammoniitolerans]
MSDIFDYSFRKILAKSASDAPTPGGGSISALAGALGVAMVAMVGHLTMGRPKYAEVEAEARDVTGKAYLVMAELEKLMAADIAAFSKLMDAYRLPRDSGEEKSRREEAVQKAAKGATRVPLEIAETLLEALAITERISRVGNKMAISDAGVAAYLCEAALQAVLLNVDINVGTINEPDFVAGVNQKRKELANKAGQLRDTALAAVKKRIY